MQTTEVRRAPAEPGPEVLAGTVRRRFGRISPWTVDLVTVALVATIVIVEAALPSELHRSDPVISLTINLLAVLALLLRRRAPVLTLALISAVLGLPTLVVMHDLSFWGVLLGIGLSHYMVVRLCPLRTAWLSLLLPVIGIGGYWALTPALRGDPGLLAFLSLIFTVTFVAGRLARKDAERRRELAAALARLTGEQEERHRLAVLDERSALARDLHDVVAHALSLMNVSAQQARDALPADLPAARASVLTLETAGRNATADLRRMLGLLRENDSIASATEPTPDLDQLPVLVERMRTAGLTIAWRDTLDAPRDLPAGLELAALRIVQESLTNVLRHAGPTSVQLRVDLDTSTPDAAAAAAPDRLMIIEVIDSGSVRAEPARVPATLDAAVGSDAGHGLVGMRERVDLYGGEMRAGPHGSGFAVRVELPGAGMMQLAVADRRRSWSPERDAAAPDLDDQPPATWRRLLRLDVAITVAIMVVVCLEYAFPFDDGAHAGNQQVSLVLSLLGVLPLAVRRLRPLTAFAMMCAIIGLPGLVIAHTFLFFGGLLPLLLGLATVFRYRRLRVAIWAVPILLLSVLLAYVRTTKLTWGADGVFLLIFIGLAAFIGVVLRSSAGRRDQLAVALGRVQQANAVRDRTAVLAERSRVARDLHDVVAHAVSLMLVQAGAARLALEDGDSAVAEDFLAGITRAGADADRELDAMLRALRTEHDDASGSAAHGLTDVPELVEQMRAAGLDVGLRILGDRPQLSPGLDLAAYRIVQEGLTNVLRHAGPTEVELTVSYQQPLQITMIDSGPRGPRPEAASSGQGLIGMTERAALFGGRVQADPLAHGWLLRVWLPIPEAAR